MTILALCGHLDFLLGHAARAHAIGLDRSRFFSANHEISPHTESLFLRSYVPTELGRTTLTDSRQAHARATVLPNQHAQLVNWL